MIDSLDTKRKRLIFRSMHRGTKEMDLILGGFAQVHVPGFDAGELAQYEGILGLSDPDLYNWITGQEAPPANIRSAIFEKLMAYRPPAAR
ncbi:MAG: succinate dehydrogenase assembly factor 2 [Alphaproteobacteria bacterium]|nr:succinate dehydrogenase assembly factor 2 [Alphaproteobacteria bacterium]